MADAEQNAWVRRVLQLEAGTSPALPAGTPAAPLETKPAEADAPGLAARLKTVREDLALHKLAEPFIGMLRTAAVAVQGRDPGAEALVDTLENEIAAAVKAKRTADAAATIADSAVSKRAGVVGFAKIRLRLNAARGAHATAAANLEAACSALLETPDFIDDPRSSDPNTLAIVADIGSRVPDIEPVADEVEDVLDKMVAARDPDTRARLADGALKAIGRYRSEIDAEPLLEEMENSDAGSFAIHGALAAALDDLAASLRA